MSPMRATFVEVSANLRRGLMPTSNPVTYELRSPRLSNHASRWPSRDDVLGGFFADDGCRGDWTAMGLGASIIEEINI